MTSEELFASADECEADWREQYNMIGQDLPLELRACECIHAHGGQDAQSGNVEAPTGYFYRVDRWIVTIDNYGFKHITEAHTEADAIAVFNRVDDEYSEWDTEEE